VNRYHVVLSTWRRYDNVEGKSKNEFKDPAEVTIGVSNLNHPKTMKQIGLIGGMSWESSLEYYRIVNQELKRRLGGWHSARVLMASLDFDPLEQLQRAGDWDSAAEILIEAAQQLEKGGADFLLICSNTMHKIAPQLQAAVQLPLVHIAEATARAVKEKGLRKVGLLGTRFTMEEDFLKGDLSDRYGLEVLIPDEPSRRRVHEVIYQELCLGHLNPVSKRDYLDIIRKLGHQGAQGVILGCTEIPLLVQQQDVALPLFDTTTLHATAAVDLALAVP